MKISLIVAAATNNVIGRDGGLPWHLSDDLKRFKKLTVGHCVVMGCKTFDSLGSLLSNRKNLVLTRRPHEAVSDVEFFCDLRTAIDRARELDGDECFIAGGEDIYREGMEIADRIYLTRVDAEPEGDTRFPEIDEARWRCVERKLHPVDERHAHSFTCETWERVD